MFHIKISDYKVLFNNRSKNSLTSIGTPLKNCFSYYIQCLKVD